MLVQLHNPLVRPIKPELVRGDVMDELSPAVSIEDLVLRLIPHEHLAQALEHDLVARTEERRQAQHTLIPRRAREEVQHVTRVELVQHQMHIPQASAHLPPQTRPLLPPPTAKTLIVGILRTEPADPQHATSAHHRRDLTYRVTHVLMQPAVLTLVVRVNLKAEILP